MSISEDAKRFYEANLRDTLERSHHGEFVAIEPESGSRFLGQTFVEVALAAKAAYPERKSFVLRIGHDAAFHLGAVTK